jgi:hypothetical protein
MFAASKTDSASEGYQISRSLRFNSADSAYLTRTPASAGNRKTYTISVWCKRASTEGTGAIISARTGAPWTFLGFSNGDGVGTNPCLQFSVTAGTSPGVYTNSVLRDLSAWYHIVLAVDTTQATASNRVKIYINSVLQTLTSGNYPTLNQDTEINNTIAHEIGNTSGYSNASNFYLTEYNFIDGQALTPSSFGETNAQTGVWQPKAFSGTYGTNGFYLNFSDNSNTTAATLGKDYSGNGNNFTPNGFLVSAGAGNDSMVDVPTPYGVDTGAGGTVRGNYCTLNPLSNSGGTWSNGNLQFVGPNNWRTSNSTIAVSTGQWYWEVTLGNAPAAKSISSDYNAFGFGLSTGFGNTNNPQSQTNALILVDNAYYKNFSGAFTDSLATFASGDVLSIAVDLDANTFTFRKNNSSLVTGTIGGTVGRELTPIIISYSGDFGLMLANFGQRPFAYTAPSGFKALCTQNLPTPTIGATTATQAGKYFNAVLYTGNNSTQSVTGVGFQPDLVWCKSRSNAYWHTLVDSVRGRAYILASNTTNADIGPEPSDKELTAFTSDGFNLGPDYNLSINSSGATFVAWNWKANGTGVSNTAGSITSTVSANTTSGFSVVTFTATADSGSIGHGLGVAPSMIIIKSRNNTSNWVVYHVSTGAGKYLNLNNTDAVVSNAFTWQNTTPTSSVFYSNGPFATGYTEVAYCFAAIAGYSAFGQYTGNGSSDGAFVYTGFRPAYVLIKRTTSAYDWWILDAARGTINAVKGRLYANAPDAESTTYPYLDFLSNGFKLRDADGGLNASGEPYIYACFAQNPFKYSLAR